MSEEQEDWYPSADYYASRGDRILGFDQASGESFSTCSAPPGTWLFGIEDPDMCIDVSTIVRPSSETWREQLRLIMREYDAKCAMLMRVEKGHVIKVYEEFRRPVPEMPGLDVEQMLRHNRGLAGEKES